MRETEEIQRDEVLLFNESARDCFQRVVTCLSKACVRACVRACEDLSLESRWSQVVGGQGHRFFTIAGFPRPIRHLTKTDCHKTV